MAGFIILVLFLCGFIGTIVLGIQNYKFRKKFKPILDIESELEKVKNEIKKEQKNGKNELDKLNEQILVVKNDYQSKKSLYDKLLAKINIYEEKENMIDYGLYSPSYSFDGSEKYKIKLQEIRAKQKELVKSKNAVYCRTNWSVDGSEKEGKKQTELYHKLMLRAFNGECDSIISGVKWNNANKAIEKIRAEAEAINKIAEKHTSQLTISYIDLKIEELKLKYEYEQKLYDEKEEQRQIREQMKEEERALKELEKAQKDAEKEEERYQKALDEAKSKLVNAHGEELEKLNEKMRVLEQELAEAKEKRERALSMAQQTKAGHVYIISNIGSFGEDVYKIGMTRRLEPMDRVKELGDASVPFEFDVHGMIFSENAPELENLLHKEFNDKRLNMINNRKEFFNVSINDIEEIVKKYDAEVELTKLAEARQYRESIIMRNSLFENTVNVDNFESAEEAVPEYI